jgi:hypothetical protein
MGSCGHSNKPSGCIRGKEFLYQLNDYKLSRTLLCGVNNKQKQQFLELHSDKILPAHVMKTFFINYKNPTNLSTLSS